MNIERTSSKESSTDKNLLSYLSPEEKHRLVGSFVVEDFWDGFKEENSDPINRFREMAKESIPEFIEAYQDVWDYVVDINQLDDLFLAECIEKNKQLNGMSLAELRVARNLLSLSLYSELEKDCLMALNKTILGELADDLRAKYEFNDEEYQLLMTPSFETFFTKYHFDHLEYAINDEAESKEQQKNKLIQNFHANDPELFALRFAEMHFPAVDNLIDMLTAQKAMLAERAAKKVAFIGEREDLIAFEKLLEYDNFLDFKYRYNLEACPEYYVRKKLFSACQEEGLFADLHGPMSLKDSEFIKGVNNLIDIRSKEFLIELNPRIDVRNIGASESLDNLSINSSHEEIMHHLAEGSPCVANEIHLNRTEGNANGTVVIVGYSGNILLAKDSNGSQIELTDADLYRYDSFTVLKKYDANFFNDFNCAIEKFINRAPYLDRSEYENGLLAHVNTAVNNLED